MNLTEAQEQLAAEKLQAGDTQPEPEYQREHDNVSDAIRALVSVKRIGGSEINIFDN